MIRKSFVVILISLFAWTTMGSPRPTHAAEGLDLYTAHPGISVTPGQSVDFTVDLMNHSGNIQSTTFHVNGLPKGWDSKLTADGIEIKEVSVRPGKEQEFTFTVNVPLKVNKGDYDFTLASDGTSGLSASLPLFVTVTEKGTFKTELDVDQPNMQGHADADFTYTATLSNKTANLQRYALTATSSKGWDAAFNSGGKSITSVEVQPNSSKNIDIMLTPPKDVKAGTYQIEIKASNGSTSAKNVLEAVVTGTYSLELTTPTGNLSTDVTAGNSKVVTLKLTNKGSSDLKNIKLSSTPPPDWDVSFNEGTINHLAAGKSTEVKATITASDNAIAGDYVTKMSASTNQTSSDAEFRVSVKTSLLWGWIAIVIVLAVIAGIWYLFRKYGRR